MKAVVVEQIGDFRLADTPRPEPGAGEVLIQTAVTGLCRTDLKIIKVGHRDLVLPRVPGEEVVGTVCAVGPDVDSKYYVGGHAGSIAEGVGLASAAIADGSALAKLKGWVAVQNVDGAGAARLEQGLAAL